MKALLRRTFSGAIRFSLMWGLCSDVWSDPEAHGLNLFGTVVDAAYTLCEDDFASLDRASSQSEEEFGRVLMKICGERLPVVAVVTAQSGGITRETISDIDGKFKFGDLPQGVYEVFAKMPPTSSGSKAEGRLSAKKRIRVVESSGIVHLALHKELIAVSGQVTDNHGQPIAGAKVTGTPVPFPEVGLIDSISTVSEADGTYELNGFEPLGLYIVAGYLNGGSLNAPDLYTHVEIRVEADQFEQIKENVPSVPLVAKAQILPARRLWKALSQLAMRMGEKDDWQEMKPRHLPASQGNRITDIDVVLDHVGADASSDSGRE